MDISEKYGQLAVKVKCTTVGSGCIVQPDTEEFTYVFTAKHCLLDTGKTKADINKEDIIIKRFDATDSDMPLKIIDYWPHEDLDLAIILVERIKEIPDINVSSPVRHKDVTIFGYPKHLHNEREKTQELPCKISIIHRDFFEMISNIPLITYDDDTSQLVKGFSGSGVFYEREDNLTLIGIFMELKSSNGGYQTLFAIDIIEITKMLGSLNLPDLTPSCLLSFTPYLEAFDCFDVPIKIILDDKAKQIIDLNPKIIAGRLGEQLFLPFDRDKDIINQEMWNGWIKLLTYIFIDKEERLDSNNYLLRNKDGENLSIKFYYSDILPNLEAIIRHIFTEIYDNLKHNDIVVVNGPKHPVTHSISNAKLQNIVKQIDSIKLKKFSIDEPQYIKNISCMHLQKFAIVLSNIEESEDFNSLYANIKESIKGVLDNAI